MALAPQSALAGWTFCVADAGGGDIWISQVFAASRDRERLEGEFRLFLKARGVANSDAQCPVAKDDKTETINAQFTAIEFHRKLGDTLHELAQGEFAPRR